MFPEQLSAKRESVIATGERRGGEIKGEGHITSYRKRAQSNRAAGILYQSILYKNILVQAIKIALYINKTL
jgi:hypothetical protein